MDVLRQKLISFRRSAVAFMLVAVAACARNAAQASDGHAVRDSLARARQDSIIRAQPDYVVDSIFPTEEELRRFNAGVSEPVALDGGAESVEQLVRQFSRALRDADTSALRALLVNRAEFGYFVFPESPYARPPFKSKPGIIWMQLRSDSERGMKRLLARVAGPAYSITELRCQKLPEQQGVNRYWRHCSVLLSSANQAPKRTRLFGQILEREGRAKFLSYAGDF